MHFWNSKEEARYNKREAIRVHKKENDNNPVSGVSVDQLQSYQPGLVPQFSGKLTNKCIWSAQLMVDHFSDLTYIPLTRRKTQEDTLSGKSAFERWATKFGVKIRRYHAENGIFSEQPLIPAIEDANQNITFCWVGYHHQNTIVERKNLTLTLGAITLLINQNKIVQRQ